MMAETSHDIHFQRGLLLQLKDPFRAVAFRLSNGLVGASDPFHFSYHNIGPKQALFNDQIFHITQLIGTILNFNLTKSPAAGEKSEYLVGSQDYAKDYLHSVAILFKIGTVFYKTI